MWYRYLVLATGAGVFLVLMVRMDGWAWVKLLWLGLVVLAVCWLALLLWHRRQVMAILELENQMIGRYRRIHPFQYWPKACIDCGAAMHEWRAARDHSDPAKSACAAHIRRVKASQLEPVPYVGGRGDGAVDTHTDAAGELEAAE